MWRNVHLDIFFHEDVIADGVMHLFAMMAALHCILVG